MSKASLDSLLEQVIQNKLLSGHLSGLIDKHNEILKISIRPIIIKQENLYQCSFHQQAKVIHQNMTPAETAALIAAKLGTAYKQGIFHAQHFEFHVLANKQNKMTILQKAVNSTKTLPMHNRQKKYVLEEGAALPFLIDLGVMTADGKVIAKKYDKFKQINRFLEMVRDVVDHLPKGRRLEIIDFGCGKAYLTFALYHYLHEVEGLDVNLLGLDLKKDVIEYCQALAKRLGYDQLNFALGDIDQHTIDAKVDMVIALHACDTATDAALEKAVNSGAEVILCAPCCQHELYAQIDNGPLTSLLQYGILKERFAALATDAARAEILTMLGYDVQILEFIDMGHTPKNLLIRAVKRRQPSAAKTEQAKERYQAFSSFLNITPNLWQRVLDQQDKAR